MKRKPVKPMPKMTKGKAFVLCLAAVMLIFGSMFALGAIRNNTGIIPVDDCLKGIGALAGMYIVGSVANNGVKGKFWNQDMFDSENREVKK
jgi:hypothetical protein